ncbi:MAG TPA: MOSC domain-containing protein [Oligoflexia bacterium]|nr:MOSC domain-containing protein [Oligoflexia bacterium]
MQEKGKVAAINVSKHRGTVKRSVPEAEITADGIAGDAHAGPWHRQVTLLSQESIDRFAAQLGRPLHPGAFAENITSRGIDLTCVRPADRISVGDAILEVTQIGKECHGAGCEIFRRVGRCVMPVEGVFCRVIRGGTIRNGTPVRHYPANEASLRVAKGQLL